MMSMLAHLFARTTKRDDVASSKRDDVASCERAALSREGWVQRGGQRRTVGAAVTRKMDGCELGRVDVEAFGVGRTLYGSADAMMAARFRSILYCIVL
jgi:hypothetical protein